MSLSELADFGELLGGIAVIASLVYLALQVRQNTRAVRGSTLHLNTDLWASLLMHLSDPAVTQAYFAGMAGRPDIKPLHYTQFYFIAKTMFLAQEDQFYQAREMGRWIPRSTPPTNARPAHRCSRSRASAPGGSRRVPPSHLPSPSTSTR